MSEGGRAFLSVRVLDLPSDTQVAGRLYRVDNRGRLKLRRSISIPNASGALILFLEAGTYAVEAVLPSGQIVSHVFELAVGQDLPIGLNVDLPSPHEWMRWETYAGLVDIRQYNQIADGNVEGRSSFQVSWHNAKPILDWDTLDTAIRNRAPIDFAGPSQEGPWFQLENHDRLSQKILVRSAGRAACVARAGAAITLQPVIANGIYRIVMYGAPADRSIRAWMTVVDNPIIASALAYQARGAIEAAKSILEERHSVSSWVVKSDRDVCAVLYAYLHARDCLWLDARRALEQLCQSSLLADVYILSAWYRLLAPTDTDLQLIEDDLHRAYARGLPAFSQGVRLLRDGLALFGNHRGGERADVVRRVARRVDFTQPFTSLRLSSAASRLDDPSGGAA